MYPKERTPLEDPNNPTTALWGNPWITWITEVVADTRGQAQCQAIYIN